MSKCGTSVDEVDFDMVEENVAIGPAIMCCKLLKPIGNFWSWGDCEVFFNGLDFFFFFAVPEVYMLQSLMCLYLII